jgi:hypothetical protein
MNADAEFPLFGFSLPALLATVRGDFPSLADWHIEVWIHEQPTLAFIRPDHLRAVICLHSVLNHSGTPEQVIAGILRHELLHLLHRPREIEAKMVLHPPEFWTAERRFADTGMSWAWINLALGSCLRRDVKRECTYVTRKWKTRMNGPRLTWEQLIAMAPCTDQNEPLC